jgi:glycosyltransferase involved in cell wall biosynthesis
VFAISQAVDNEMQNYYRRHADAVVRPAANAMFSRPEAMELIDARSRYHLHGRYNLIVGTLEPRKNLHLFISQYLLFHKCHPEIELPLLALIGGKGWNDAQIVEAIEEGEQCGLVRRLGYVPTDDLPALYSAAELFFMPSRYEGFGMPILEARICGCPTVCSDVPAMREAGGQQALYHAPSAEGIYAVLVSLYTMNHFPVSDFGAGVDWTWESGAATILGLFHDTTDR